MARLVRWVRVQHRARISTLLLRLSLHVTRFSRGLHPQGETIAVTHLSDMVRTFCCVIAVDLHIAQQHYLRYSTQARTDVG